MRAIIPISLALCGCDGVFKLVEVRSDPDAAVAPADEGILIVDGLVARYTFDSIESGQVRDAHGANHGSCVECPTLVAGQFGAAALFDGVRQIVEVPATAALTTTAGFTISAWVRLDTVSNAACPMSKQYANVDYNTYQLCALNTRELYFYSYDASQPHGSGGPRLPLAQWHHVAMRYDGIAKSIVFNGILGPGVDAPIAFDTSSITFGADLDSPGLVGGFTGAIDEVRIYNRALDAEELAILAVRPL